MTDPEFYYLRLAFNEFLYQNLADEYLMFWHAVEVAKRETDQEKLRPLVYDLYKAFIKPGALFCINLDAQNVKLIETKMELEYLDMEDIYENAQAHVEEILKSQFYPDFLKSETLRHFVRSLK
uniref:RGS domain-containing protein n=1 Tax=Romanomermis culicivorax TaxID=13658 RepID=A0A915K7Y2_ROMCU